MVNLPDDESQQLRIKSDKVLLVEGKDEKRFFEVLLKSLGAVESIQTIPYGGKGNLKSFFHNLRVVPGFTGLKSLGVTRDADCSSASAFQSVCRLLRNAGFDAPDQVSDQTLGNPQVSVFIFPDYENAGMLETLCLSAVKDDPAIPCVEQYFQCLAESANLPTKNPDKARAHVFLASRDRPELRVGEAAEAGHWQLDSPVFDPLKNFLLAL